MDGFARLRRLVERMTPNVRVEHDDNGQPNLYGERGEWVALFPHQCLAALEVRANVDALGYAHLRNTFDTLAAVVEVAREGYEWAAVGLRCFRPHEIEAMVGRQNAAHARLSKALAALAALQIGEG